MKQRRTSLKDLAEVLGVSMATVSRALRGSHEVGDEMKAKVQALAKQMNYRPNPFAQSLRREAPRVIGVIVPNLVTHYYASVLDGIEDYASRNGYSVISANSHESHLREEKAIESFISMHVEGIIACLAQDTVDYQHYLQLHEMGIPVVPVCPKSSLRWLPTVMRQPRKLPPISLQEVPDALLSLVGQITLTW